MITTQRTDLMLEIVAFTSIHLEADEYTGELYIDPHHCLLGPFHDLANDDVRLFISYQDRFNIRTFSLIVMDATDGAFLNSNAIGTEEYQPYTGAMYL